MTSDFWAIVDAMLDATEAGDETAFQAALARYRAKIRALQRLQAPARPGREVEQPEIERPPHACEQPPS